MSTVKNFLGGASGQVCNIYITGLQSTDVVSAVTPMSSVVGAEYGDFLPNPLSHHLPSGFTEVEYIESSGSQYINTTLKYTNNYGAMDITVNPDLSFSRNTIVGSYNLSGTINRSFIMTRTSSTSFGVQLGTSYSATIPATSGVKAKYTYVINNGSVVAYVNDEQQLSTTYGGTIVNGVPLFLFGVSKNGSIDEYSKAKMYEAIFYEDVAKQTILRHFIPCHNDTTNKYGLLDISNPDNPQFYGDANGGNFSAGNTVPEYLPCFRIKAKDFGTFHISAVRGSLTYEKDCLVDTLADYEVEMPRIPSGYDEVTGFVFTGSQYADIDLKSQYITMDYTMVKTVEPSEGAVKCLTGWNYGGYGSACHFGFSPYDHTSYEFWSYWGNINSGYSLNFGTKQAIGYEYNCHLVGQQATNEITINGTTYYTSTNWNSCPTNVPLYWGCAGSTGGRERFFIGKSKGDGVFYNSSGVEIARLVHCVRSDETVGLYDLVRNTFYPIVGTIEVWLE